MISLALHWLYKLLFSPCFRLALTAQALSKMVQESFKTQAEAKYLAEELDAKLAPAEAHEKTAENVLKSR